MDTSAVIARVRQPEYIGENRCGPCTVINGVIVGVCALVLAALTTPAIGLVAFSLGGVVIYLRGYLIPGTPALTKRYFPPWLLGVFGKAPSVESDVSTRGSTQTGKPLVDAGILLDTPDGPMLAADVQEEWNERTSALLEGGIDSDAVAEAFDAATVSQLGETSFVLDGTSSMQWGSTETLAADVAGATLLNERVKAWSEFDRDRRRNTLRALRLCLERCPACEATLALETERVDPCCQKPHRLAAAVCEDCGAMVADVAVVDTGEEQSVSATLLDW
ncbi:hypothetical protein [Halomarina rubra]|uniref:PrgI family protein n=1 Tax=Halomarina rubra TaxID=2071873 RepID=A0ABD6AXN2_9EURY|nr:hypothetical protein [Halomarina rubra]